LLKAGGEARYLPTGHLLYQESSNVLLVPFDLAHLKPIGEARSVLQGLPTFQYAGEDHASLAVSATGTLVHESGSAGGDVATLVWVNRSGQTSPLPMPPAGYFYPRVSPDGARVAVNADNAQIWICDLETGRRRRLTQGGISYAPVWTNDGKWIAFTTYRSGYVNIFWKPVDSDGQSEPLVVNRWGRKYPASRSPDGRVLIYNTLNPAGGGDIWSLPIGGAASPLRNTRFQERLARLSPDGRWLAYVSNESGRDEVYVRPFAGPGETRPVSTDGGDEPVWSNTGRELFYRNGNTMMTVEIAPGPEFRPGKPQRLFDLDEGLYDAGGWVAATYDVSRDDQRFLMIKRVAQKPPATELKVIVNWLEEVKAKVRSAK
jgi:eukaryotic-like serine/threonine-protein kinase